MDDSSGNDHDESSTQPKKPSWMEVQTTGKRIRIGSSPEIVNQPSTRPAGFTQQLPPLPIATKIPPITVKFESGKVESDREIGADLIDAWRNSHNRKLNITVRFGYMKCLLVFANDCNTFEELLERSRWPALLKGAPFTIQFPRILPSEYSIVIRQFHKNWVESEVEEELRAEYPTLVKLTRMFVKEGTALNLVRADFKSISQVKQLLHKQVIHIGKLEHPVKPYHSPVRIERCKKCHSHDHSSTECQSPPLCMRCSQQHPFKNGCTNEIKCANCGQSHYAGHSACPQVQKKRLEIADKNAQNRAQMLVRASLKEPQQPYQYREQDFPVKFGNSAVSTAQTRPEQQEGSYADAAKQPAAPASLQRSIASVEHMLSSCLANIEHRLREFETRLLSHMCDIEKKIDSSADRATRMEGAVYDVVLPIIRRLTSLIHNSTRHAATKAELARFGEDIEDAMNLRAASAHHADDYAASPSTPTTTENGN